MSPTINKLLSLCPDKKEFYLQVDEYKVVVTRKFLEESGLGPFRTLHMFFDYAIFTISPECYNLNNISRAIDCWFAHVAMRELELYDTLSFSEIYNRFQEWKSNYDTWKSCITLN